MKSFFIVNSVGFIFLLTGASCREDDPIEVLLQFSDYALEVQQLVDDEVTLQSISFASFGISVTVHSHEQGAWIGVGGVSHEDVEITPYMVFNAASITKTFAALALQLQEDGTLSLDEVGCRILS